MVIIWPPFIFISTDKCRISVANLLLKVLYELRILLRDQVLIIYYSLYENNNLKKMSQRKWSLSHSESINFMYVTSIRDLWLETVGESSITVNRNINTDCCKSKAVTAQNWRPDAWLLNSDDWSPSRFWPLFFKSLQFL